MTHTPKTETAETQKLLEEMEANAKFGLDGGWTANMKAHKFLTVLSYIRTLEKENAELKKQWRLSIDI